MKKQVLFNLFGMVVLLLSAVFVGSLFPESNDAVSISSASALALAGGRSRAIFDKVRKQFPGKKVVPGYLRVEQTIVNGKTNYRFNFTSDKGSTILTEKKLNRTDQFLISHLGLFLSKRDETAPNAEVLQTYPNLTVFSDGTTFVGKHLEAIYNGSMSLKVKSTVYIENLDLQQFREIGAMAQSSGTTYSETKKDAGFIELTPNVKINGNDPHNIELDLPITDSLKVANDVANMSNHLVVVARGFLIKE